MDTSIRHTGEIVNEKTQSWLRNGNLMRETESHLTWNKIMP